MSKTWDTKKKILELLEKKKLTLTDISKSLDLAPSTVNQHIKELLAMGAIHQVYNPFILKWKYYEKDPNFNEDSMYGRVRTPMQRITDSAMFRATAAVLAIIIVSGLAIVALGNHAMKFPNGPSVVNGTSGGASTVTSATSAPPNYTVFSISDSPPLNASIVSAVNVTVSNMSVHSASTGKWYAVLNTPETFNLAALNNISQLVAASNITKGAYDELKLEVSNVTATVNGTTSNVFIPTGDIIIPGAIDISGNGTSWVNLDVNLAESLHMTGSGKMVMLPVINIYQSSNAIIGISNKGMLEVKDHGREHLNVTVGMGLNGSIGEGAQVGEGAEVEIETHGNSNQLHINNTSAGIRIEHNGNEVIISRNESHGGEDGHRKANVTVNESVNATGIKGNGTISNLTGAFSACETTSQCTKVPKTYCQNGLPQQSTCINLQYLQRYMAYFNSTVASVSRVCPYVNPEYIISVPTSCQCIDSECTLVIGSQGGNISVQ